MPRSQLKGTPELRARLRAIKVAFKPIGREWADTTAKLAKSSAPVRTGKGRRSIRRKHASMRRASVQAVWYMRFVDRGAKPHIIRPKSLSGSRRGGTGTARSLKFEAGGRTIFSRRVRHPGVRKTEFARKASNEAIRRNPMARTVIRLWNEAA